jgi:hypothetical protein
MEVLIVVILCLGVSHAIEPVTIGNRVIDASFFLVPASVICFAFRGRTLRFMIAYGILLVSIFSYISHDTGSQIYACRNFFGVKRVVFDSAANSNILFHGMTKHGEQFNDTSLRSEPLMYYHPDGPLGDVFVAFRGVGKTSDVAVIGLGVGALSCYALPGQTFSFYEIDPQVVDIARDKRFFTFLSEMKGKYEIVQGDGRLMIANAPDHHYGMVVLDAFSSDSIPAHLLTEEAIGLYLAKLEKGVVLVFHITNRFLDMEPLLGNIANELGMFCLSRQDFKVSIDDDRAGMSPSHYVVMGMPGRFPDLLLGRPGWHRTPVRSDMPIWTDQYSNLLSLIKH